MNILFWLELELSCRRVPGPGISYIDNHHKKYKINVSKTYLPSLRSGKKEGAKKRLEQDSIGLCFLDKH